METFNHVFSLKMRNLDNNPQPPTSQGRMVDVGFSADRGYCTPHSNQIVLGLVQRKKGYVQIQLQQGPLIIATADIDFENFEDDPVCGLTLQTNPLSMFNVYPLHVFEHEPNDFFQKCGYGRLALYFSLLYTVCTGSSMAILCENPITAYILFILFRSEMTPQTVDMITNHAKYFDNLGQYEASHGRIAGFQDFQRFYSSHEAQHGQLVYTVHATETNKSIITRAIEEWTKKRISCVSDQEFMANFWVGPKLREYHTNPLLQKVYPHVLYGHQEDMDM
jgi:hypothetical protein